jgi:hypothetical protein
MSPVAAPFTVWGTVTATGYRWCVFPHGMPEHEAIRMATYWNGIGGLSTFQAVRLL